MIGDIAKVLHVSVFLNVFDYLTVAELAQSTEDGGGDQEAKGVSGAPFLRTVKRGEALNDGLPRDNVVQDDQIMCGVGQMSLDPLGERTRLRMSVLSWQGPLCGVSRNVVFDIIPPIRGHRKMPWERKSADTKYLNFVRNRGTVLLG